MGHCATVAGAVTAIFVAIGSNFSRTIAGVGTGSLVLVCQPGWWSRITAIARVSPGATLVREVFTSTLTGSSSWARAGAAISRGTSARTRTRRSRVGLIGLI